MSEKSKDIPAQRYRAATADSENLKPATNPTFKRARRAPRLPGATKPKAPVIKANRESGEARPERCRPTSVENAIEILSQHREWANMKAKFAARLRAAGVSEDSLEEVSETAIRRILERQRDGLDAQTVKWTFAWEILTKYIFPELSDTKKKRFRLYAEQIGNFDFTPREQQISFYVVWGLSNKEIGERIGTEKDNVNKHIQKVRRKLGIGPVGVDDRLNTVLNLLGL